MLTRSALAHGDRACRGSARARVTLPVASLACKCCDLSQNRLPHRLPIDDHEALDVSSYRAKRWLSRLPWARWLWLCRSDATVVSATVISSAAMSSSHATTMNNQAEYTSLLSCLREATRRGCPPLDVVGDSQMILQQMQQYRPPRQRRLREDYAHARRLADTLGVQRWHHHYRAQNQMADAAAKLTVDAQASSQRTIPQPGYRTPD